MRPDENQQNAPTPTPVPPVQPPVLSPNEQFDKQEAISQKQAKKWRNESILINIFASLIILVGILSCIALFIPTGDTPTSNESATVTLSASLFVLLAIFGTPVLLGFFMLRRSNMARKIIIVFMLLNIALQVLPFLRVATFNPISVGISLAAIIFLSLERIKRHF